MISSRSDTRLEPKGNVGFIFTNDDLEKTREVILAEKVAAPARAGAVAPLDVYVPAGNTGMEPGKTSFFQALGVPTKIARGTIEITADLKLVEAGAKVGASEATLLNMLNISPFTYGLGIAQVYDNGQTFAPEVLDIKDEQLLAALGSAITTIASISLATNYPTLPSVIHSLVNGYKNVLAVAIGTEYSWPEIDDLKDRIANPDAYASAAPAAGASSGGGGGDAAPAAGGKQEEEGKQFLAFIRIRIIADAIVKQRRRHPTKTWASVFSIKCCKLKSPVCVWRNEGLGTGDILRVVDHID
jgi:large subunit ribosomal protein LP0